MDKRKLRLLYLLYLRRKRSKRVWVHSTNKQRPTHGVFNSIYGKLREDNDSFSNYFGMSVETFDELLDKLKPHLQKIPTQMRDHIEPEERLAVTLRYLFTGSTFTELHLVFKMGTSTISSIVCEVCSAIWTVLKDECIPTPSADTFKRAAEGFATKAHFPNCIGTIDGKCIQLKKPYDCDSTIMLLVVVNHDYRFIFVDVEAYGNNTNSPILKNTSFWKDIESGRLTLPPAKPLPGINESVPHVFVVSEAFSLHQHLMRPFGGRPDTTHRVFNDRLTLVQMYAESALGIFSNKWRIFQRPMNVSIPHAIKIIKASCILHNFVISRDGYKFEDTLSISGLYPIPNGFWSRNYGTNKDKSIRKTFTDYFNSKEGALEWQMDTV